MTSHDPITAIADQLAAHAGQLTRLEARQDEHHAAVSGRLAELTGQAAALGRAVAEHAAARTNDELLAVANDMYGMGWDTQTQIVNRRGWLQSAGMLTDMGDGKVKLSEKGQLLLSEISLHDPTSGPAVIKVVEVTTTEDSVELSPLPDSLVIDKIVSAIKNSANDSSHPDRFEPERFQDR